MTEPTIFALSSGAPPAAIGIVRVSGSRAAAVLQALHGDLPAPRRATLGWLHDPVTGERLDRALLLWLPGPRTATGEDLVELHLHGGRAVVDGVLDALGGLPDLRRAEAGEFTRRAFANGVVDLAEVEGLADLLTAETASQRRNAQLLMGGVIGQRVAAWQQQLLALSAQLEAFIEYGEEEDLSLDLSPMHQAARRLCGEMASALSIPPAERLRDGVRVVLGGPPNAGKSTLLNAIVGREAAITSPMPGTTRDLIEVPVTIRGTPFLFVDTAGIRDGAADAVETLGIAKAEAAAAAADILMWLGQENEAPEHPCRIVVHARSDARSDEPVPSSSLAVSAVEGTGVTILIDRLVNAARGLLPGPSDLALNRRQREALSESHDHLQEASLQEDPVLAAEDLRLARSTLDRLTGTAGVEEMLDALFGRFCIGK